MRVKFHHLGFTSFRVDVTFDASNFFTNPGGFVEILRVEKRLIFHHPPPQKCTSKAILAYLHVLLEEKKNKLNDLQEPTHFSPMMEKLEAVFFVLQIPSRSWLGK